MEIWRDSLSHYWIPSSRESLFVLPAGNQVSADRLTSARAGDDPLGLVMEGGLVCFRLTWSEVFQVPLESSGFPRSAGTESFFRPSVLESCAPPFWPPHWSFLPALLVAILRRVCLEWASLPLPEVELFHPVFMFIFIRVTECAPVLVQYTCCNLWTNILSVGSRGISRFALWDTLSKFGDLHYISLALAVMFVLQIPVICLLEIIICGQGLCSISSDDF